MILIISIITMQYHSLLSDNRISIEYTIIYKHIKILSICNTVHYITVYRPVVFISQLVNFFLEEQSA